MTPWPILLVRTVHLIRRYRIMFRRTHDVRYLWGLCDMQREVEMYLLPEIMTVAAAAPAPAQSEEHKGEIR